jgi:hypothetical protein
MDDIPITIPRSKDYLANDSIDNDIQAKGNMLIYDEQIGRLVETQYMSMEMDGTKYHLNKLGNKSGCKQPKQDEQELIKTIMGLKLEVQLGKLLHICSQS